MKLYHYSKNKYDVLKSLAAQDNLTAKEKREFEEEAKLIGLPIPYHKQISFFFDPIPLDIIADLFKGKNDVWKMGTELFQYEVDVNSLEPDIWFLIAESPEITKFLDSINWQDGREFLIKVKREKIKKQIELGEIGQGLPNLIKHIQRYKGMTRYYYIQASKRKDFEEYIHLYAAFVPHVMLVPKSGIIKYNRMTKVVVGKKTLSSESFKFLNW